MRRSRLIAEASLALLIAFSVLYALAYFLLVRVAPDLEYDGPIVRQTGVRADYWLGGNASAALFAPINKIDRWLRRKYWEYPKSQTSETSESEPYWVPEPNLRTICGKVAYALTLLKSDSAPRRQFGARGATKLAERHDLTVEHKTQLLDALKKAMEVEKDQEALAREKEAVVALEAKK